MGRLINPDVQGFHYGELRKARKSYVCWLCGAVINPGDEYVARKPFWASEVKRVCLKHV